MDSHCFGYLLRPLADLADRLERWKSTGSSRLASGTMRLRQLVPRPPHRVARLGGHMIAVPAEGGIEEMPPQLVAGELACTINSRAGGKEKRKRRVPPVLSWASQHLGHHLHPAPAQPVPESRVHLCCCPCPGHPSRLHLTNIPSAGLGPRLHPRTLPCLLLLLSPLHNQACPHPRLLDVGV